MHQDGCAGATPQFLSPTARFANRMLQADWSQEGEEDRGESGLLVRTVDDFDKSSWQMGTKAHIERSGGTPPDPIPPIKHLPSSFLHGSLRAPGAIHQGDPGDEASRGNFSLLYGTKFRKNTIFKRFQTKGREIDIEFIYPHNPASISRGTVFDKSMCNDGARDATMCIGNGSQCLANGPGACGGCLAAPENFGALVSEWALENHNLNSFVHASCYYDDVKSAVTASNSLWMKREEWFEQAESHVDYQGHTECGTSLSIQEKGMADAVVLALHRTVETDPQSACHFPHPGRLSDRLKHAYGRGHGDLPVLFYRESLGINTIEDCSRLLGGRRCDDAYHKEFFSQEYQFDGGDCLHKPPGCDEAYYFPADGETCSARTDKGKKRIAKLCGRREKRQDARVAYDEVLRVIGQASIVRTTEALPLSATPKIGSSEQLGLRLKLQTDFPEAHSSILRYATSEGPDWVTHFLFFVLGILFSLLVQKKLVIKRGE